MWKVRAYADLTQKALRLMSNYEEASESSNGSEAFSLLDLKRCKVQASAALVDEI